MTVSTAQLNVYFQLCKEKGVAPQDTTNMTGRKMWELNQELMKLPSLAYPDQIEQLKRLLTELVSANVQGVKMPSEKFFNTLNVNSARDYIRQAQAIRQRNMDKLPPTDEQLNRLVEMYLFPEIEWEQISTTSKETVEYYEADSDSDKLHHYKHSVSYTESITINRKIYSDEYVNGKQLWRFMTPDEFREELRTKLTHSDASRIIQQYQGEFEAWKRTRITFTQKNIIRRIEDRLASIYTPKQVTQYEMDSPFHIESDTFESNDTPFAVSSKKLDNWNPTAYVRAEEQQLDMLSREDADKYIRMLNMELSNPDLRNVGGGNDLDYAEYGIEDARTAKSQADARTKEFKELNNFLYGLADITGNHFEVTDRHGNPLDTESLRSDALNIFFNTDPHTPFAQGDVKEIGGASQEQKTDLMYMIADFVKLSVRKLGTTRTFKVDSVFALAERNQTANEIMRVALSDQQFAQELVMLRLDQANA